MSDPVNLNKLRKSRARDTAKKRADANAAKFGLTKAERSLNKARADKMVSRLDAHRRDTE